MQTTELFRTCANEYVAAAALACIGGRLERRVAAAARRADLSIGAYVAWLVADYDRKASPRRRKSLEMGMLRHDTPLLAGLRHVVETALEGAWDGVLDMVPEYARARRVDGARRFLVLPLERPPPWRVARPRPRAGGEKPLQLKILGDGRQAVDFPGGVAARIFSAGAGGSETTGGKAFIPVQARLRDWLGRQRRHERLRTFLDRSTSTPPDFRLSLRLKPAWVGRTVIQLGLDQRDINSFALPIGDCAVFPLGRGEKRRLRKRACWSRR